MNTSEFISKYLEKKIKKTFLVTGGGMMFLTDALNKSKIKLFFNHHEQASIFATDAYARSSGKPQVCFATSGPGITNCVTGILSAWQDSTPIIIIAGQSKSKETIQFSKIKNLRQSGTFEANAIEILKPITKFRKQITNANSIKYYLDKAFYLAKEGRPGPVYLEIPLDIQSTKINSLKLKSYKPKKIHYQKIDIQRIEKKINKSKKPLLLLGNGLNVDQLELKIKKLVNKLKIPLVTTQFAKSIINYDNQFFIGHTGPKGDRAGNLAVQNSDLLIILGSSLHSQTIGWEHEKFSPNSYKIQIDPDPSVLKKNTMVNLKIKNNLKNAVSNISKIKIHNKYNLWKKQCLEWKVKYQVILEPHKRSKEKLNYYDIVDHISKLIPQKSTIISDAGAAYYIMGQCFRIKENQKYIIPGSHGQMGYAIPASSGVAANINKNIYCVTGDGSLMTNLHELSNIKNNAFNIKIFIINNNGYMSIRNSQREFFGGKNYGTDKNAGLLIPKIKEIANFFKIKYYKCKTKGELTKNFKNENRKKSPAIFDCFAMHDHEIIPSIKSKLIKNKLVAQPLDNMYPYLK